MVLEVYPDGLSNMVFIKLSVAVVRIYLQAYMAKIYIGLKGEGYID